MNFLNIYLIFLFKKLKINLSSKSVAIKNSTQIVIIQP